MDGAIRFIRKFSLLFVAALAVLLCASCTHLASGLALGLAGLGQQTSAVSTESGSALSMPAISDGMPKLSLLDRNREPGSPPPATGEDLLRRCKLALNDSQPPTGTGRFDAAACLGYVAGYRDAVAMMQYATKQNLVCMPEEGGLEQAVRVIVKWLEDNPKQLHFHEGILVLDALRDAFPCAPSKPSRKR